MTKFPTDYNAILKQIEQIKPVKYCKTRNFLNGDVTYLSPYISRGVISTKQVYESVIDRGFYPGETEKFVQELAWRDYWQQVWIEKGNDINYDLKNKQEPVANHEVPTALVQATTNITAIDNGINKLYETGYMHNHLRMYVGAIACNMANSHWLQPAKWMYYHLLDADWASNALSWQWVAGANANKSYVANQDNINKFCNTKQRNTFLDVDYSEFDTWTVPEQLKATELPMLKTNLPESTTVVLDENKPTALYNWYNLDPKWLEDENLNRVLLLEPSIFEQYPISDQSVEFMLGLAKNIDQIKVVVCEFKELANQYPSMQFHFKEHPLNNYKGVEHKRDWMTGVKGYYPSFFKFWNRAKKELR